MVKYGQEIQQKNVFRLIGDKEMKEQIKKIIARNPILYIFLQLCKYRKDKEYIELVRGLRDNPNIINAYKGEKNFDKTICLVEVGGDNDGFFACVRWALDGLYFCNQFGFIPVVKFSDNSLYSDNSFPDNKNVFEYYLRLFKRTILLFLICTIMWKIEIVILNEINVLNFIIMGLLVLIVPNIIFFCIYRNTNEFNEIVSRTKLGRIINVKK